MPEASPYNSSSLRAYLLGQPAQQETADDTEPPAISDEQVFADDALYLALEQERHDLIADFVDGRLSAVDAATVREQCLHSPAFEQEVAAHRALRTVLEQQPAHAEPRTFSSMTFLRGSFLRFATNGWMLGTVLAGVTAIAVLLFALWRRPPSAAPSVAQQAQPAATPMRDIAPSPPPQVFFLAEGQTRGDQGLPRIQLREDTSEVDLQLPVRRSSGTLSTAPESWHLELREGDSTIWSADDVLPKQIGAQTILVARVPAASLHPGSFRMRMMRRDAPRQFMERSFVVTSRF